MGRKVVRLTLDHLAALRAPCRECLFWEMDPVRRARVDAGEAAAEKEAWVSRVLREWGSCGRVALVDDLPVGYVVYAPPAFVPGADGFPTAPVSPDAVLMTTVYVDPRHAGGGLGRMLIQGMAKDLITRGELHAVEAFGHRRPGAGAGPRRNAGPPTGSPVEGSSCVLPADFLDSVGFKTQRAHHLYPRMRMDLRSALSWREEIEAALERIVGVVRPAAGTPRPGRVAQRTRPSSRG